MRRVLITFSVLLAAIGSCLPCSSWGQESLADDLWKLSAFQEALEEARGNLIEKVYMTKIDSATTLNEYVQIHPEEIMPIENVLSGIFVSQQSFDSQKASAHVEVRVPVDAFPYPYRTYFTAFGSYIVADGSVVVSPTTPEICGPEDFGWADGAMSATGEWIRPQDMSLEDAAKLGFRAARANAMRALAHKVEAVRTNDKTVGQYVKEDDVVREKVQQFIQKNVVEQEDTYAFADVFLVSLQLPLMQLPEALGLKSEFPVKAYCPPTAQEKTLAHQKAQQNAYEKMISAVYEVPMKKYGTVSDYVFSKPGLEEDIEKILHESEIVRKVSLEDGSSQVEVRLKTRALPRAIRKYCQRVLGEQFSVVGEGR